MSKKLLFCCAGMVMNVFLGLYPTQAGAVEHDKQTPLPARSIPGITAEDSFPNGCVDCHINYKDKNMDTRFSTLMKQWTVKVEPKLLGKAQASAPKDMALKGRHPKGVDAFDDIPANCMFCHRKGSKTAPPFAEMIHNIHLTGGQDNHFLTIFQGECTHCHKLDLSTGRWTMPSAREK